MRNNFAKKLGLSLAAFGLVATSVFTGSDAQAVPAFARQTGMACNSCHFQNFPALNQMGRSFKAGSYSMEGSQASIEGENAMKLPDTLNIGAVLKMRHNKGSGDYTETGSSMDFGRIDFPDESALLIGGRASANAGFLWEVSQTATGPGLLGSKLSFQAGKVGDIDLLVIPYMTDGQGPTYGFELLNTASLGLQRYSESKVASAPVQVGFVDAAAGLDLVASAPNWYFTFNQWAPVNFPEENEQAGNLTTMATFIRGVFMMDLAGFDTAFGIGMFSGTAQTLDHTHQTAAGKYEAIKVAPAGSYFDFQMQGDLAGMMTGIYVTSASVPAGSATADGYTSAVNTFAAGADADGNFNAKSASGVAAKISVMPELSLVVQTGSLDDGSGLGSQSLSDIGVQYMIAQNIKFEYNIQTTAKANTAGDAYEAYTNNQMMLFMAF